MILVGLCENLVLNFAALRTFGVESGDARLTGDDEVVMVSVKDSLPTFDSSVNRVYVSTAVTRKP